MTRSNRRLQFRSNSDLILIKIDQFQYFFSIKIDQFLSISIIFGLEDQKRPSKCQLFNQKWSKTTEFSINSDIFDQIPTIFDVNLLFRYKSDKI